MLGKIWLQPVSHAMPQSIGAISQADGAVRETPAAVAAPLRKGMLGGVIATPVILRASVSERAFQRTVTDFATLTGWLWTHFRPARTSKGWRTPLAGYPGFVDLVMVRRGRVLFAELKAEDGKPTPAQCKWLWALAEAGAEVYVFKPSNWPQIEQVLR